jgi:hypothetical protein
VNVRPRHFHSPAQYFPSRNLTTTNTVLRGRGCLILCARRRNRYRLNGCADTRHATQGS